MASPRRSHRDKITPYRYTPSLAVAKHKARLKSNELAQPSNINKSQGKTTLPKANGIDIGHFIRKDLHEILQTLPSTSLLNKMNSIIQESCSSFLADKLVHNSIQSDKISTHDSPIIQLQNRGDNVALSTISNPATDDATATTTPSQNFPSCPSCSRNIVDYDFIICVVCDEKFHFQCQNITSDFCKSMSFETLERFQCMQCNASLKDLSICELESINQITEQSANSLNSPDTIVKTVPNNNEPVKLSLETGTSDHISRSNPQDHLHLNMHSIKQPTNARAPENITPSSQTHIDQADTTNKHTKQAVPKKQKNVKQEDLKSKLASSQCSSRKHRSR
ncbi:unnamed protein product [Mytilus edulis]|uniref:PHD-type domain-containing protein n=1 Tax=Mytilus edulis TaxID=6550 RepID=A0A8S3V0V1_MYTED|nr:unnamed protein product [Mytilus edulis]